MKNLLLDMLPKSKDEKLVFIFFALFYLSYSLYLVFCSSIIDCKITDATDLYFSFDTPPIFKRGFENREGHPFLSIYTRPIILLGDFLVSHIGYKFKTVMMVFVSSATISLSVVYIYRYLSTIVEISKYPLYLLTLFFGFMSTNLILCFTPESYTMTIFLLSYMILFYSLQIKNDKEVAFWPNFFFAFALGGVTLTNFAKGMISMLFLKGKKVGLFIQMFTIGLLFAAGFMALEFKHKYLISGITYRLNAFVDANSNVSLYEKVIDYFFGIPIFFSKIYWLGERKEYLEELGGQIAGDVYHSWIQYLFIGLLLALLIFSFIKNYRNKLVLLIAALFGFDIALHLVFRYGLAEGYIYGAHWIYVVPLLLGWLYKSLDARRGKYLIIGLSCMSILLVINNMHQLVSFINMAVEKFPVDMPIG